MTRLLKIVIFSVVLSGVAIMAFGQTLPRVELGALCKLTMGARQAKVYSGPFVIWDHQYGFLAVNAKTGAKQIALGVGKAGFGCSARVEIVGDCWQSVSSIAATNGSSKWIVATGLPTMCGFGGLQVWRWNAARASFDWVGVLSVAMFRNGIPVLDGDTVYTPASPYGIPPVARWIRCDLNAMTCDHVTKGTELLAIPHAEGKQNSVDGATYTLTVAGATFNDRTWIALRDGEPIPTVPVPPTRTAGPPPPVATATRRPTAPPSGGCYPPDYLPGAPIPRCTPTPGRMTPAPPPTATRVPPTVPPAATRIPPTPPPAPTTVPTFAASPVATVGVPTKMPTSAPAPVPVKTPTPWTVLPGGCRSKK